MKVRHGGSQKYHSDHLDNGTRVRVLLRPANLLFIEAAHGSA